MEKRYTARQTPRILRAEKEQVNETYDGREGLLFCVILSGVRRRRTQSKDPNTVWSTTGVLNFFTTPPRVPHPNVVPSAT